MLITKSHIKILQNFIKINPALYYDGTFDLSVRSNDKILRAEVYLPDFIDIPFAFYDMGVILPFMKEGYELDITSNNLVIKTNDSRFKYRLSSNERIKKEAGNNITFATFTLDNKDIAFNIKGTKLKDFISSCNKLGCDTIDIYSRNSDTYVMKGYVRNSKSTSSFECIIECEHEHNSNVYVFDISKFIFIDASDLTFEIGLKVNKAGITIPVMKTKAFVDNIEVKYILASQEVRTKENTDE